MTRNNYQSYAMAAFAAVAVAIWAGLPVVLVPFTFASVFFVVYLARVVRRGTVQLTDVGQTRFLDGSHERIDDPE
jgi:hypothetical protein